MNKKTLSFLFILLPAFVFGQAFITTWDMATVGSITPADRLQFNIIVASPINYTWTSTGIPASGSGTITNNGLNTITGLSPTGIVTLNLGTGGTQTELRRFFIQNVDRNRLTDVVAWGTAPWTSMASAFNGCINLNITATDLPNLSGVINMENMFRNCTILNGPSNINDWNTSAVTNMSNMFWNATAFNQNIGGWNTAAVINMSTMFRQASAFNQNIGSWTTNAVTLMNNMFRQATAFNQNIGGWNTAVVTNMSSMFREATNFNNDGNSSINNWTTAAVTNMGNMFDGATAFNQNIGSWNTTAVTNMQDMFRSATNFNNGGNSFTTNWNTGAVTNMETMFQNARAFNQNIGNWSTSLVTNMDAMFFGAILFNQNIGSWTLNASVTMVAMLNSSGMNCANYASTLIGWNANGSSPNGRDLGASGLTYGSQATAARANLTGPKTWTIFDAGVSSAICGAFVTTWNMANTGSGSGQLQFNVTVGASPLSYTWTSTGIPASGSGTITTNGLNIITGLSPTGIVTLNLGTGGTQTQLQRFFIHNSISNGPDRRRLTDVTQWGTAPWTSMASAFNGCNNLNITATDLPNLGGVTTMFEMFRSCTMLNGPSNINSWNTAAVRNMASMFREASAFNQNIGGWNTINVVNMAGMFREATAFNQNIGGWNTIMVTGMTQMFRQARAFNQNIGSWNTSLVTDMSSMFQQARAFNQNVGSWNTTAVTSMIGMFLQANAFNQNVGAWNTINVRNMSLMFNQATNFNNGGDSFTTNWNTNLVTNMAGMFQNATAFNQNIGNWRTAFVTNMSFMFSGATAFKQNIGNWTLNSGVNMDGMLNNCGLSVANYDATLTAWNTNGPNGRILGALGLFYCASASNRANLVLVGSGGKGWTIAGDTLLGGTPALVATGITRTAPLNCGSSYYNSSNRTQKLISINPNGNTFSPTSVTINNNNVGTLPTGVSSVNGYYQINNGTNTFRVSNQLVSILAPGTFSTNGGIIVRVYYDATQMANMSGDVTPSGTVLEIGWFKSSLNNAAAVVGVMSAGFPNLSMAEKITPSATGTESGIAWVEFTVQTFSSFGIYTQTQLIALPINLLSFTAINKACNENIIKWTSADEVNFSHYNLEWSADGNTFSTVALIKGKGEVSGLSNYSFNHNSKANINFYRLKSIDMNGTFAYSSIANSKNANCNGSTTITLMPNPTEGLVNIVYGNEEQVTVKVYQIDGKLLNTIELNAGNKSIDLSAYKSGVYSFVIISNGATIKTERILKM